MRKVLKDLWARLTKKDRQLPVQWKLIRVDVGTTRGAASDLQHVEFSGEQLASCQAYVGSAQRQEVLYRTSDGSLVVHVRAREKLPGFPTVFSLHQVEERELAEGGIFEKLGREWRVMSLDQWEEQDAVCVGHDTGH